MDSEIQEGVSLVQSAEHTALAIVSGRQRAEAQEPRDPQNAEEGSVEERAMSGREWHLSAAEVDREHSIKTAIVTAEYISLNQIYAGFDLMQNVVRFLKQDRAPKKETMEEKLIYLINSTNGYEFKNRTGEPHMYMNFK